MVFFGLAMYLLLVVFFVVDVLRQASLSRLAKAVWIAAVVFLPVIAWLAYGLWRITRSGGLPRV